MALIMEYMQVKLEKVDGQLKAWAAVVKKSSEDDSMKASYEREITLSESDATALSAAYDSLQTQVKTEDSLT